MIETFVVDGVHSFLSNFYESEFILPWIPQLSDCGGLAKTAEHAYQSMKASKKHDALLVLDAATPGLAKKCGRAVTLRPDWEEIKIPVMRATLNLKFAAGTPLATRLLETEDQYLQEGNTWGDTFWGVCDGHGQNWLGFLLMARRAELRGGKLT